MPAFWVSRNPTLKTAGLTALAMLAFAANSLLCRAALAGGHTDATNFTALRLAGGAVTLGLLAGELRARCRWPWADAASLRLVGASFLTVGGIALAVTGHRRRSPGGA